MIRFLLRSLGLWLFAGAFVAALIDGMKSLAASRIVVTAALTAWSDLAPGSEAAARGFVSGRLGAAVWRVLEGTALALPTWAVLLVLAALAFLAGRRPKPGVGVRA